MMDARYPSTKGTDMPNPFQPAVRETQRANIAISGPAGSGKTMTALIAATEFAAADTTDPDNPAKIAVIDTENGRAALYSNEFTFDHCVLAPPFSPARYIELIEAADANGYAVLVIDSLSHGWNGKGGVLEIVDDAASKNRGNKWAGWAAGTPAQNALVQAIVQSNCHVIVTLRSQTEWMVETDEHGKNRPVRVGTKPVQRDGIEYEFTIVADMDLEHNLAISKSPCHELDNRCVARPDSTFFGEITKWMREGIAMASRTQRAEIVALRDALKEAAIHDLDVEARMYWMEAGLQTRRMTADDADGFIDKLRDLVAQAERLVALQHEPADPVAAGA